MAKIVRSTSCYLGRRIRVGKYGWLCLCLLLAACGLTTPEPPPTPSAVPTSTPLPDVDGDGTPDVADGCPALADPARHDLDHDKLGDACDPDLDGDNQINVADACPFNLNNSCVGAEPVSVNLLNPSVLQNQAAAGIGYIGLTIFENPDPSLPMLLNGRVYPASDAPLWTDSSDLTLTLTFDLRTASAAWPSASGDLGLAGGSLSLSCPAAGVEGIPGTCSGHLKLNLTAAGNPLTEAPQCLPGDARCAWSVNAAFGSADLVNVWGGYDAENNELRFSTGLPIHPGNTFTTGYTVEAQLSEGGEVAYSSLWPAAPLPYVIADGENDCSDAQNQPVECLAFGDLRAVTLEPVLADGAPFLVVQMETAADLPLDRRGEFSLFSVFVVVNEGEGFTLQLFEFFPDEDTWQIRGYILHQDSGEFQPMPELPAHIEFAVEGNRAALRLPLLVGGRRTVSLPIVRVRTFNRTEVVHVDAVRDEGFDSTPLVAFQHATDPAEAALPLILFHQYENPDDEFHAFLVLPFPGGPLAELLNAPLGE